MGKIQTCIECDQPTERCEDDFLACGDHGPLCDQCFDDYLEEAEQNNKEYRTLIN